MSPRPNGQLRARRARVLAAGAGAVTLVAALLGVGLQSGTGATAASATKAQAATAAATSSAATGASTASASTDSSNQVAAVTAQTSSGGS